MNNETVDTQVMPEVPVVPTVVEQIAPVPAPIELPEQIYEYQPTDESDRALGGRQVIKYRTVDELRDKLTHQNILLVRKLRDTTRKQRLGIDDDEQIPETAPRFDVPLDFSPRTLTDEERVRLSRDLVDPERFDNAKDTFFEATVGVRPDQLRNTLSQLQTSNLKLMAKLEADAFVQGNSDYYRCKENFEMMTNWMLKKDLAPVRENFQLAYNTLKVAGLLLEAPIVREEAPAAPPAEAAPQNLPSSEIAAVESTSANAPPIQETPSRITTVEPAQTRRAVSKVATGLTRDLAGDAGIIPKSGYTLREINSMPSHVYKKKLLSESGFKETVERLERESQARKLGR